MHDFFSEIRNTIFNKYIHIFTISAPKKIYTLHLIFGWSDRLNPYQLFFFRFHIKGYYHRGLFFVFKLRLYGIEAYTYIIVIRGHK